MSTTPDGDLRPPNAPWIPCGSAALAHSCLSFYLSDDLGSLPVRAVTLPANNKSDPNLETKTYGLFSTCQRQMRSSIVKRALSHVFFVTRREEHRVLAGYYHIGWYCAGVLDGNLPDYSLAAKSVRFVDPIALEDLPPAVRKMATRRWRTFLLLGPVHTATLVRLVDAQPDRTSEYLAEIDRLERFNQYHTGFRCWGRQEPFTWKAAGRYLQQDATSHYAVAGRTSNSSPTDYWLCAACDGAIRNKALLKSCPECDALGSLRPVTRNDAKQRGLI